MMNVIMKDTIINRKLNIRPIEELELILVEEEREEFYQVLSEALFDKDQEAVHVIKKESGIGKTEAIKMVENFNKTVIAY